MHTHIHTNVTDLVRGSPRDLALTPDPNVISRERERRSRRKGKERERKKNKKKKGYDTSYSRVVPHRSTDDARGSLTSEFGWDRVLYTRYGRNRKWERRIPTYACGGPTRTGARTHRQAAHTLSRIYYYPGRHKRTYTYTHTHAHTQHTTRGTHMEGETLGLQ